MSFLFKTKTQSKNTGNGVGNMKTKGLLKYIGAAVLCCFCSSVAYTDDQNGCYAPYITFSPSYQEILFGSDVSFTATVGGQHTCDTTFQYRVREEWNDICGGQQYCAQSYDSGWITIPGNSFVHTITAAELDHNSVNMGLDICNNGNNGYKTWMKVYLGCADGTCEDGGSDVIDVCLYEDCVQPPSNLNISGPPSVCNGDTETYSVQTYPGATYTWSVTGGTIVSGQGTSSVQVNWTTTGSQSISVTADNPGWCSSASGVEYITVTDCCVAPSFVLSYPTPVCENESVTVSATPNGNDTCNGQYEILVWQGGSYNSGWQSGTSVTIPGSEFSTAGNECFEVALRCAGDPSCVSASVSFCVAVQDCCVPGPSVNITGDSDICWGETSVLTANVSPAGNYTYLWSTGQTTPSISVTAAGVYTVTVTDDNGCTATDSFTVNEHPSPTVTISPANPELCAGGAVQLTATGSGGTQPYTFTWSNGDVGPSILVYSPGTYTVTITDANGCSMSDSVYVTQVPGPTVTISGDPEVCPGGTTVLTANPSGGTAPYTYLWSGPGVNGQTSQSVTVSQSGNYSVAVTDANGCTGSASIYVAQSAGVSVAIMPVDPEFCAGGSVDLTATVSGGTAPISYSWSGPGIVGPNNTAVITVNQPGTYTVTVTDANGCTDFDSVYVSEASNLVVAISPNNPVVCAGGTAQLVAVYAGGTAPYTFVWSGPGIVSGQGTDTIVVNQPGTYQVTLTDANGCTGQDTVYVAQASNLSVLISPTNPTLCTGSTVDLTASATGGTAPYSYSWSGPGIVSGQNSATVTVNAAGTYTVTVTDANGCTGSASVTVTQGSLSVQIDPTSPEVCTGGQELLVATPAGGVGPYTYQWGGPGIVGPSNLSYVYVNQPGLYTVTVTDANGCVGAEQVYVEQAPDLTVVIIPQNPTICPGGTVDLTAYASGGAAPYSYSWSGPGIVGSSLSQTITVNAPGTYTVTVTDNEGCTGTMSVQVYSAPSLSVTITPTNPTICPGGTAILSASASGGTAPYTYVWSGPGIVGSNLGSSITVNAAGTYTVSVTDSTGCTGSASVVVTQNNSLNVSISPTNPQLCGGGTTQLTAIPSGGTAPYTYVWSGPGIVSGQGTDTITVNAAGTYTVTVTDAAGCTGTDSVTVTTSSNLNITITPSNPTICSGQSAQLTANVSGGTGPYTYSWSGPGIVGPNDTQTITVTAVGTYTVTVTDANGCTGSASVYVGYSTIDVNITPPAPEICAGEEIDLTATPSGGTAPFTYGWTGPGIVSGQGTATITINAPGVYTVTVTDANGCSAVDSVQVTECGSDCELVVECPPEKVVLECTDSTDPSNTGYPVISTNGVTIDPTTILVPNLPDPMPPCDTSGGGGDRCLALNADPSNDGYPKAVFFALPMGNTSYDLVGGTYVQDPVTGTATLDGTLVDQANPAISFSLSVELSNYSTTNPSPIPNPDPLCSSTAGWEYYYEMVGQLVGISGPCAGVSFTIQLKPGGSGVVPWQQGVGANTKNCEYGASAWILVTRDDCTEEERKAAIEKVVRETPGDPAGELDPRDGTPRDPDREGGEYTEIKGVECDWPCAFLGDIYIDLECETDGGGCGDLYLVYEDEVAGDDCYKEIVRTWTLDGPCIDPVTCEQVLVIEDTQPPVISCPPDITIWCTEPPTTNWTGSATANDACGDVTITYQDGPISGSCPEVFTRRWTATDDCGNSASCDQVIAIDDNQAPVIACPGDVTVDCDEGTDPSVTGSATANDNCSTPTITYSDGPISGACPSSFTRTWTATDDCGNQSQCQQTIYVDDTEPPVITSGPPNVTLGCNEPVPACNPSSITVTDNCGTPSVTCSDSVSTAACIETTTRTYTATDVCGNTDTWVQTIVRVVDTQAPTLNCAADVTIECDESTHPSNTGWTTTSDNCGSGISLTFSDSSAPGTCPAEEVITRTWTATDDCGNSASCTQTITVEDSTPPTISCPPDVTIDCDGSTHPSYAGQPTASDNCGPVSITFTDGPLSGDCPATFTRIWTARDGCGNEASCTQEITVDDDTIPVITCPPDTTTECSGPFDPGSLGMATATDDCGNVTITYSDSFVQGTCVDEGTGTRTWIATDDCGNTATCDQTILVYDTTPPVFVNPPVDATLECDDLVIPPVTATDNCDPNVDIDLNESVISSNCVGGYVLFCTWTATDNCGNQATTSITLTIVDTTPPVITCPPDVTLDCDGSGNAGTPTVSDNCDPNPSVTFSDGPTSGNCPSTFTRTWTATDDCGNSASCTQQITVDDNEPPTITCPPNVTIECDESDDPSNTGSATATDDCSSVTVTYIDDQLVAGTCDQEYTLIRTWIATDACGNQTACEQNIVKVDKTAPTITCPPNATLDCTTGGNTGTATATDNCDPNPSVTYSDGPTSGNCPSTFTRTWTATDDCGNSASCTQQITVDDNEPPTITCPPDVTIECDASDDPSNTGTATATDDCSSVTVTYIDDQLVAGSCDQEYTLIRTWIATDACGNQAACEQKIKKVDTTAPSITCPPNATLDCDGSGNAGTPTVSDNCDPNPSVTYSDGPISGGCPGTFTRTWTATDDCGNSASCTQQITVDDNEPPTITCPPNVTIECDASDDPSNTGTATATDDCSSVTVTYIDDQLVAGTCDQEYTLIRTWIATDACGNQTACEQNIKKVDTTAPTITCPPNATLDCTTGGNTGTATATDNCDPNPSVTYSDGPTSGNCPSTFTRTWTATDDCGNSASCTQQITVDDTEPPVITCPPNVTVECDESTNPSNTGNATATDDCSSVTVTYSDASAPGTCPQNRTITRTWTATDACGNSASCTQTITVVDTTPPTISCPSDKTIECDDPDAPSSTGTATASDNCSAVTVTYIDDQLVAGTCDQEYTLIRTWIATDDCGNQSACEQKIKKIDVTPPTITCPPNATLDCAVGGNTGTATASDNCDPNPTVTYSDGPTTGDCPSSFVRTWTATDDCGNQSSCTQTIVVDDDTPPTITCPPDVTVECDESTNPSNTGSATASDDCSSVTVTYSDAAVPGTCPQNRVMTRTWTATDACGNSASCQQKIYVVDTTPPTIICPPDVTLDCDGPVTTVPTVSDNCDPNPSLTYSDSTPSGSCPKTITRTWSSTDACGNTSSCTQTITIDDDVPPVITCPPDVTIDCDAGGGNTGTATATDNCGSVTITFSDGPGSGDCPATFTRTWTATDDCGNTASCDQQISINDTTPPTISCPANVTVECDESTNPSNTGTASATDDCSGASVTYSDSATPGTCTGERTITRTWTATDGCGNTSSCTQTIQVVDTTPPTITCPPDVTIDCDSGGNTGTATASDNCSSVSVTYVDDPSSGNCPETFKRTWIATDACGNQSSCTQEISIDDDTPPTITCPPNVTVECDESVNPSNTGSATASDDCSSVSVTYSDSVVPGTCANEGIITRTWTATDACGNSASCIQKINVVDTTPPVISCPPDVTVDCDLAGSNTGTATATDNCGSVSVTYVDDPITGNCPETFKRTWIATDACGNQSSCTQEITIDDTTPPTISCPPNVTVECDESTQPGNTGTATASDDCSNVNVTYSDSVAPGTCPDNEVITRTWTATDACGNTASCTQTITVRDTTPPTIICPPDVTIDCTTGGGNTGTATATDNCGSVTVTFSDGPGSGDCPSTFTRTWTATDECGNSSSCTQQISINDDTPPTISCPPNVTVECDESTNPNNTGTATATDDCSGATVTYSDSLVPGTCPQNRVITRTWTATDGCGNTASCTQKITVQDTTPPVVICPPDVTLDCDGPVTTVPSVSDNCDPNPSLTYSDSTPSGSCPKVITRTWSSTDACGNTGSCTQLITIDDDVPPVITCPPDVTIDCDAGGGNTGTATATDNCGSVTVTFSDGPGSGNCPATFTRTWTATDDCGNTASCDQEISINDTTPPTISCPPNVTVECDESYGSIRHRYRDGNR